ncbi:ABC transporter substrate-binding protein [Rhodopseudomonas palustris]|uniref:ABC transporter substrate-binding protein n=1 Tax=Rhodopseudomonas palustris TaxID=1076 RepID=A0A418V0Q1_RHOPL|nr:ABC transporter substrate-binding protein [Rhodopseudomonas palustris]RJF69393.1 ABC transporter substrate-binding protein [Rhodopseudomonas palustris]
MKHLSRRFSVLAALAAVALVGSSLAAPNAFAQAKPKIVVGVVLPLTGVLAPYGKPNLDAISLAVDEANKAGGVGGREIELVVEDTQASNTTAINALNKVLQSQPVAIIGPGLGTQILAMMPMTEKAKVPLIAGPSTRRVTQQGAKYFFRDSSHDEADKVVLANFIVKDLKKTKVGIMHVMAEWGYSGRDFLTQELKKLGVEPVAVASYQPTDKDMTAQVMAMKSADADVVYTQGYPVDEALVVKKFNQLESKADYVASASLCKAFLRDLVSASDMAGKYCQAPDVLPTINDRPAVKTFVEAYKKKAGFAPDMYIAQDYDAVGMLISVMKEKGADREAIREGMATKSYDGILGTYKADEEGNLWHSSVIMQIQPNGDVKVVARK